MFLMMLVLSNGSVLYAINWLSESIASEITSRPTTWALKDMNATSVEINSKQKIVYKFICQQNIRFKHQILTRELCKRIFNSCNMRHKIKGLFEHEIVINLNICFSDVSELMVAVFDETGLEQWQCLICNKICKRKYILKDHIESHHLNLGGHECNICGNKYNTKNSLQKHTSTYHKS